MLYCAATWWTASTVDNDEKAHRRARRMPPGVASCVPHVARCRLRGAAVLCAGKYRAGRGRLRDCTAPRPFPAWRPRGTCALTVTSASCTAPAHSHERNLSYNIQRTPGCTAPHTVLACAINSIGALSAQRRCVLLQVGIPSCLQEESSGAKSRVYFALRKAPHVRIASAPPLLRGGR